MKWGFGAIVAVVVVIVAIFAVCGWGFYTTQLKTSDVKFTVASKDTKIAAQEGLIEVAKEDEAEAAAGDDD